MSRMFEPSTGYFQKNLSGDEWQITGHDGLIARVPILRNCDRWRAQCNAALLAGSPEMLDTLVRAHNRLNVVDHEVARKIQGSIRGGLVKVVGSSEMLHRMRDNRIEVPSG